MGFLKYFSTTVLILGAVFIGKAVDNTSSLPDASQSPPVVSFIDSSIATPLVATPTLVPPGSFEVVEDTATPPPCDIIFFKAGKIEYCKIIEANPTTIVYKMCDYQEGPNIIVNKTDVHKIRYANGREEVIIPQQGLSTVNAHVKARKDKMATWALISSLVGLVFTPLLILGVVLGIISLVRINRSEGTLRGKGSATAAIILGGILLLILLII